MIPAITEVNFPSYATLHQATVSLQDMGDRVISTQVRIDGDVVPDFSGWELRFKGERFVLPSDNPQAMKDNTTRNSLVDLQFQSWAIQELKRYYFFEAASVSAGVAIADKYVAPVRLNVEDFVAMLNDVLDYYFDGKIVADLYLSGTGIYSQEKKDMEINYSYLWEVIGKVFEVYGVRNVIEYNSTNDVYTIKFGYPADEIDDHTFEYGYQGGLLKFERQVQDETISNILLGRGGEKNLPYRYFKRTDPQNPEWAADPDAIPELANIYFDRLRDINFRRYVQGWRTNPNRDTSWEAVQTYDAARGATDWAYKKGHEDEKFSPVEYVKDDESIAAYGEHWGALDDNDEIYPTIQGRSRTGLGRIDEVVAVSPIITDDIQAMAQASSVEKSISPLTVSKYGSTLTTHVMESEEFTIPDGSTGNITYAWVDKATLYDGSVYCDTVNSSLVAVSVADGTELPISGIPAGTYRLKLTLVIRIDSPATSATGTFGLENIVLKTSAQDDEAWKPTFDIWVKDIWGVSRNPGESDVQYAMRVWGPILGDRVGNEAKVVFSTGFMAVSEDYEFTIADYPVPDTTKTLNGVPSAWRITLRKSDAEYDATGLYIPNNSTGGKPIAGDKFFFTGIDMPHLYVNLAEEELNTYKSAQLQDTAAVNPTWVISLDKVRVHTLEDGEYGQTLAERLAAGAKLRVSDPRFSGGDILTLHAQSVTYTWNEPSDGSPYIVPDIEVVLSDQVVSRESRVDKLEGSVDQIKSQYARVSDVESVVRKVAEPMFLKKTGESDSSESPTQFASKVTSRGFRQGGVGGTGWGFYRDNTEDFAEGEDGEGDTVLEVDRVVVRKELHVNSLVANQTVYRGGREVQSAAKIECTKVVVDDSGKYVCYFDQKQGSVKNLFIVGDFAYSTDFAPDNTVVKYYRRRVDAVDVDRIVLSDTVKDGAGIPSAGDVIIQYGHESNASRQYVIVRDVIGGGYERMISDLDSVDAGGEEYYFAGRQNGQNPRWFVGDAAGEYAEWKNGLLNIKGRLTVLNDQGAYVAMDSYMNAVSQQFATQQAQIDGQTQSWASGESPSTQTKPYPLWDEQTQQIIGTPNYPYTQWQNDTERAKHVGDTYVDDTTGQSYRLTKKTTGGTTVYYWTRITDEEVSQAISTAQQAYAAAEGLQYLKAATNEGTLVDGGLVLTSMIQLGYTPQGGSYTVMSGINGKPNTQLQDPTKSIAAWFGGAMVDHETYPAVLDYAKSLFRMDGSGYLAGGNIGWQADGDGHIPGISWETVGGVTNVTIGANVKLAQTGGTDSSVTDLVSAVQGFPNDYVSIATAQTVTGKKTFSHADGITIGGATLKWVAGTGGNPGYLQIDSALLTLGDQIVGSGTPGGGGGGAGYLYELGDIYHDTDKTKVLRTDGTTPAAVGDVLQLTSLTGGNKWAAVPASSIGRIYEGGTGITINGNTISVTANTYQPLDSDLTAIAGLSGTSGLLKKTAANTWTLDTSAYITGITSSMVTTALGYTPVNKAGDTMTGGLKITKEASDHLIINRTNSPTGTSWVQFQNAGSVVGFLGVDYNKVPKFYDGVNAERIILHSGNYSSYALPLSAGSGNALTGDLYTNSSVRIVNSTAVEKYYALTNSTGAVYFGQSGNGFGYAYVGSAYPFIIYTNGAQRMRVNSDGNVTIGASDLAGTSYKLYVNGSMVAMGSYSYGTQIESNVIDGRYSSGYGNLHLNYYSSGNVTICYGGGNLGVGASPAFKFDVAGAAAAKQFIMEHQATQDCRGAIYYGTPLTITDVVTPTNHSYATYICAYSGSGNSRIVLAASTRIFLECDTEIYGDLSITNTKMLKFYGSSGQLGYYGTISGVNHIYMRSTTATGDIRIGANSANDIVVNASTHYVGMGTETPSTKLEVVGTTSTSHLAITSTDGSDEMTFARGSYNYIRAKTSGGTFGFITNGKSMAAASVDMAIGPGWLSVNNATNGASGYNLYVNGSARVGALTAVSDISLYNASGGATPRLVFQRGNLHETGGYDWSMYSSGGNLYFSCSRSTSGWEDFAYMTYQNVFHFSGTFSTTGDQVISSDINLKKNLQDITLTSEQIANAPAVSFDWKDGHGHSFGSIAQYWKPIVPEAVLGEEGNYTLAYGQLGAVLGINNGKAIFKLEQHETEQDKEIKKLKARVRDLEKQLKMRN